MSIKLERGKESFMSKISIKNEGTQEGYKVALNNFENFYMEKFGKTDCISDFSSMSQEDIFDVLQLWINWNNSRGLAPRTTTNFFSRIKNYLHYRGIKLDPQDIKQELDFPRHIEEEKYGLKLEDIQKITSAMNYKQKTQFICQLSSCMRIAELLQIRKKDLTYSNGNYIVKVPSKIAKFGKGRTTFFSKEASSLVKTLLRQIDDDDLVFGTSSKRSATVNSEQILKRTLKKVGLDMLYENQTVKKQYKINTHSFRAYGITKLSRHDPNFAKKIAGQKGYLLEYDRMDDEEKLEVYRKFESDLMIDNSAKQKAEIEKLETEKNAVAEMKTELEEMRRFMVDFVSKQGGKTLDIEYYQKTRPDLFKD